MKKKISVVMATYNGQKYLIEQMESLRKQTIQIDEVIIMDDCSKDQTPQIINHYIKQYNLISWKLIQNNINQGWKKNFKLGFDMSTGDYIFPCDQDDIWCLEKVEKMITCMEKNKNLKLLAGNYLTFFSENDVGSGSKRYASRSKRMKSDGSLEIYGIDPKWAYINRPGCVFCFTRTFYESIKKEWDVQYSHDAILWRFARMDNAMGILNYPIINFRRHGNNATSEENRTKESRIKTFDDYMYFHKIAIDRVKTEKDKIILNKGIKFLKERKRFFLTHNLLIWCKLFLFYQPYYLTPKGCLGDLYFVYGGAKWSKKH